MIVIETNHLCKRYGKDRGIIDVNLAVKQGETFGFIGPNGAGKSTTIRTLLNFIFPTSGEAKINGLDCIKNSKKIRQIIGYLPSEVNYYDDMNAGQLFKYSSNFYKKDCTKRINELCEIFQVDKSKKVGEMSLGNKKKVGIVQALLHEPEILIFDEPTSGLDPLMQKMFFNVLKEQNKKGTTIFFSSHILSEVQEICSRVAIIKEGKILKTDEVSVLRNSQFKKIMICLSEENIIDISEINIDGAVNIKIEQDKKNTITFLYTGKIDDLLYNLHKLKLSNLLIEEPSLEEIFMHYYEKEEVKNDELI
ncbi:MAG: ABC transporter ATP-binding protein [Bacillota bacterium]|nr:ABC transporter ATP-binding protein [Bacillota bacterium]